MKIRNLALAVAFALASIGAARAQTTVQFPTTPWNGYAPGIVQCGAAFGIDANTAGDTPIYITVPSVLNGGGSYVISKIILSNASVSLTSAAAGIFTGAGATGTTVVSNGALSTLTAAALNAAGSAYAPTIASTTEAFNANPLYFNVATPQGAAATLDARIFCHPLYGSASNPH